MRRRQGGLGRSWNEAARGRGGRGAGMVDRFFSAGELNSGSLEHWLRTPGDDVWTRF